MDLYSNFLDVPSLLSVNAHSSHSDGHSPASRHGHRSRQFRGPCALRPGETWWRCHNVKRGAGSASTRHRGVGEYGEGHERSPVGVPLDAVPRGLYSPLESCRCRISPPTRRACCSLAECIHPTGCSWTLFRPRRGFPTPNKAFLGNFSLIRNSRIGDFGSKLECFRTLGE